MPDVARSVNGTSFDTPFTTNSVDYTGITVSGTDPNQVLVAVMTFSADPGTITATWDPAGANQDMPLIAAVTNGRSAAMFGCVAPVSGLKTLRVATTNAVSSIVNATSYQNANQTGGTTTFRNAATNSGTGTTVTLTIATAAGEATIDMFGAPTGTGTPTQTQLFFLSGSGPEDGGSSEKLSVGTSNVHDWTIANGSWATCGCSIKAVAAAGGAIVRAIPAMRVPSVALY